MSATNRGSEERRESDAYMTDPKLARFIVQLLVDDGWIGRGARVLEPSAGDGAFLRPLVELVPEVHVHANDLEGLPERIDGWLDAGVETTSVIPFEKFERVGPGVYEGFDAVVGNPPFSNAEAHVRKALSLLAHGGSLAFLLRLAFLESRERIAFWEQHPASAIYALAERPSFMGGRTDSTAYGVFVWRKYKAPMTFGGSDTRIKVVSWGGPERKRKPA